MTQTTTPKSNHSLIAIFIIIALLGATWYTRNQMNEMKVKTEAAEKARLDAEKKAEDKAKDFDGKMAAFEQRLKDAETKAKAPPVPAAPAVAPAAPPAAPAKSFEHKLAAGEDPSLLARTCSLLAKSKQEINTIPSNATELEALRGLNSVKSNDELPTKVDGTIKLPCDLSGDNAKAIGWAKFRRSQLAAAK